MNFTEILPRDVVIEIGKYLTPREALTMLLVDKKCYAIFADRILWTHYYNTHYLTLPPGLNFRSTYPIWCSLSNAAKLKLKESNFPLSKYISILSMPELIPLHYGVERGLKESYPYYAKLSKDECILDYVIDNARGDITTINHLAIDYLSPHLGEPKVREAFLAILLKPHLAPSLHKEIVDAVLPYLHEPEVHEAILKRLHLSEGPPIVKAALDRMRLTPEILNVIINYDSGCLMDLKNNVCHHVNDPFVVQYLLERLTTERNGHLIFKLIVALEPVADQEIVQLAFCKKFLSLTEGTETFSLLEGILCKTKLTSNVKEMYGKTIILVSQQMQADSINDRSNREQLLEALRSPNPFKKVAAATLLEPHVPHDPEVVDAFLKCLLNCSNQVKMIIVPVLSKVVFREDVRAVLLKHCVSKQGPFLATLQCLRPYVDEPKVREAFIKALKFGILRTIVLFSKA